ncbi:MAG: hypothetical protein BGO89_05155 [Candidatus Kapaibacterium thiocyanatum]|uniref:Uncharacterized protein n=1 Tax=Candidatus Kapaibacterium thiocyanatum TaxID=1895771 RepID=A0A1M3L5X6_9BACT|nr:MAG: hypothetical protein BGO89_05155 ['Candidatus Kapabacteria' thiocyanatum]
MSCIVGLVRSIGRKDRRTGRTALPASFRSSSGLQAGSGTRSTLGCPDPTCSWCMPEESCRSCRVVTGGRSRSQILKECPGYRIVEFTSSSSIVMSGHHVEAHDLHRRSLLSICRIVVRTS